MRINSQTGNIFLIKLSINFIKHIYKLFQNHFYYIFAKIYVETRNKNTSQAMFENKSVKSIQMIKH
jgi:hypothetical protein